MQQVYVLSRGVDWEGETVHGVFTTTEKAENEMHRWNNLTPQRATGPWMLESDDETLGQRRYRADGCSDYWSIVRYQVDSVE